MPKPFPNKYSKACARCGVVVPVAAGLTERKDNAWVVTHIECPTTVQPESTKVTWTPTPEQMEVIKLVATGDDLVIQAGAGAGKTSTLKLIANWALENGLLAQYFAYNNKIVKDVAADMPGNVGVSTVHAFAMKAVGNQFRDRLPAKGRNATQGLRQSAQQQAAILGLHSFNIPGPHGQGTRTLAAGWLASRTLAMVSKFCHTADTEITLAHWVDIDTLVDLNEDGEVAVDHNPKVAKHLLPFAQAAWKDMTTTTANGGRLRIEHDTYLKLWSLGEPVVNVDMIMLDEAQDADPVQESIVLFNRARGVQIICVGDEQQVLYEWRGAVNAMAHFEDMGANVAFLSQSFRFGDAVADVANGLLTRLNARLRVRGFGKVASTVGPVADPDCILTRTNAGAVSAMMRALQAGRRVHLVGGTGEIMSFCRAAADLQAGRSTMHAELAIFGSWAEVVEYSQAEEGADLALNVKLVDTFGADAIVDALEAGADEKAVLLPEWDGVTISTAHKSKGLQWDSVQIAPDFRAPKPGASMSPSDLRTAYVAVTRAKRELDIEAVPHFLGQAS